MTAHNNSIAKGHIFKGIGSQHLERLLSKNVPMALVLLIYLTNENNIGAYVSKNMFLIVSKIYNYLLKQVESDFDNNLDPGLIDVNTYLN